MILHDINIFISHSHLYDARIENVQHKHYTHTEKHMHTPENYMNQIVDVLFAFLMLHTQLLNDVRKASAHLIIAFESLLKSIFDDFRHEHIFYVYVLFVLRVVHTHKMKEKNSKTLVCLCLFVCFVDVFFYF